VGLAQTESLPVKTKNTFYELEQKVPDAFASAPLDFL
jgi:hypothetical protein